MVMSVRETSKLLAAISRKLADSFGSITKDCFLLLFKLLQNLVASSYHKDITGYSVINSWLLSTEGLLSLT